MSDDYAKLVEIAKIYLDCGKVECYKCKMPYKPEPSTQMECVRFNAEKLPKLVDAIESLQAASAEKDKRIAELEVGLKHMEKKWLHSESDAITLHGKLSESEMENARLKAENGAMEEQITKLLDDIERIETEPSTEYMRGPKYAIYEIMKEADIRGSQEIRDSGDSDDEMCAAVAFKIREAIDDAVGDAIHRIKKEREAKVANINDAEYSKLRWNGKEWEIYMGYPIGHVSLNAELERLKSEIEQLKPFAREKLIEKQQQANDKLFAENARLRAERDAAVADLPHICETCAHENADGEPCDDIEAECEHCYGNVEAWNVYEDCWQWRGIREGEK